MPASDPALDVRRYADDAMQRLVSGDGSITTDWRPIIERGLSAAREQSDVAGLVSMVQLMVQLLDGQGRYADALSEIDHAMVFARGSGDATLVLLGFKATVESATGNVASARLTADRGLALLADAGIEAQTRYQVFRKVTLWQAFEDESETPTEDILIRCSDLGLERDRTFLLSWFVPFLASLGERRRAHPWIREIRMEAQRLNSVWRLSDAAAFEAWDHFFTGTFDGSPLELDRQNAMSVWRGEGVQLRHAVLRQDAAAAETSLARLRSARRRMGGAEVGSVEQLETASRLGQGALDDAEGRRAPASLSLASFGPALAGAEAVAHSGSQRSAAEWLASLTSLLPATVRSALGWPVSVPRVLGLLALRAGDARRARNWLEESLEWTESAGFAVESALSRLQFGELCAAAEIRMPERRWKALRLGRADDLRARGYNPVPHAYAVAHSLTLSGRNRLAERLTTREVQVLGLLADGKTYREAAEILSVAAPTVQTLAHRVYQKLGVSGRDAAAAEAKRLGVL